MSSVLPLFLALVLAAPLAAGDLRDTLQRLGAEAGITVVIDRSVSGSVETGDIAGDAPAKLDQVLARAGLSAVRVEPPEGAPMLVVSPTAHKGAHASHRQRPAHVRRPAPAKRCAPPPPPPPPPPVQIDAMVVAVSPGVTAELAATGRELAPLCSRPNEGTDFLDGPGPGLKMLAFDRVDPRLNEHLPWGEVGAARDGFYEIRRRHSVLVPAGSAAQLPLENSRVIEEPSHREAIVKQALVIRPEVIAGDRIRLEVALKKGVSFPDDVDPAMMTGGRLGFTTEIALGQEVLVTGLGVVAAPPAKACAPVDPFDRFRRPRMRDYERKPCPPPACADGQVVVRLVARPAVTSVAP